MIRQQPHAPNRGPARAGFTLVELLVSMALIVLIMSILSEAFAVASQGFRELRAIGELQQRLRTAVTPLREDLLARHFGSGNAKLSDQIVNVKPTTGFFRIQQMPPGTEQREGDDLDGIPSYRVTNHILHFSITKIGNRREDWLSATIPTQPAPGLTQQDLTILHAQGRPQAMDFEEPGIMLSQSAEVAYFLRPLIDPATGQPILAGNTPLYTLHRRQRLLLSGTGTAITYPSQVSTTQYRNFFEVSAKPDPQNPGNLRFNALDDLINPARRAMSDTNGLSVPYPTGFPYSPGIAPQGTPPEDPNLIGTDLLLSDVVSFEVKVLMPNYYYDASGNLHPQPPKPPNYRFEYVAEAQARLGLQPTGVFDTALNPVVMRRVMGIQITLRVYDYKTELTRQITIVQDL